METPVKFCAKLSVPSLISCLAVAFTVGCGSSSPVGLNGNYQFTTTSTPPPPTVAAPASSPFGQLPTFAGSLSAKAGTVTGVLQSLTSPCFNGSDISVTGTLQAAQLTLTSSAVGGNTLSLKATVSTDDATITAGTYTIAGKCSDKGTITGSRIPPLKGTFSGSFTSISGTPVQTTIHVTQMPTADSHGIYHATATATFSGSSCFTKGTVTDQINGSIVLGPLVGVQLTTNEATASSVMAEGVYDPVAKTLTGFYSVTGGKCNGDSGTGTLTLQ